MKVVQQLLPSWDTWESWHRLYLQVSTQSAAVEMLGMEGFVRREHLCVYESLFACVLTRVKYL